MPGIHGVGWVEGVGLPPLLFCIIILLPASLTSSFHPPETLLHHTTPHTHSNSLSPSLRPVLSINQQGVRTKTVKKSARVIIEKYYSRLTMDFHTNKRVVDEVAEVPSKRMRNKIAGFVTHLMKRIQKGPVRGISLKLQEEERERRLDFVPEVSLIEQEQPEVDQDLRDLMEHIGFKDILAN